MPRATLVLTLTLLGLSGCGAGNDGGQQAPGGSGAGGATTGGNNSNLAGGKGGATNPGGNTSTGGKGGATNAGGSTSTGGTDGSSGNTSVGGSGGSAPKPEPGPITCRAKGDGKSTITMINKCAETLSFRGSKIEGGDLAPGEHACRDVGDDKTGIPAIRFWGYIGQDPGGERYTLAELTLNTDFNDFDWYNISHVDAHNLPMQVEAAEMPSCRTLSCPNSLLANCPEIGVVKDDNGKVISCYDPTRDDKNGVVAMYFEAGCKDAYSWSGDDQESVVACAGEDYDVIFCP